MANMNFTEIFHEVVNHERLMRNTKKYTDYERAKKYLNDYYQLSPDIYQKVIKAITDYIGV